MPSRKFPGKVVYLRVNPTESLQVLDFLKHAGIEVSGRTFSNCVSLVWHALVQDANIRGVFREVDGFTFNERMAQFLSPEELAVRGMKETKPAPVEDPIEVAEAQEALQKLLDRESVLGHLSSDEQLEKDRLTKIVIG